MKLGIVDRRWTLEDVVDMTDRYFKAKEDAAFIAAFESPKFTTAPSSNRVWEPVAPKTPWYLDPESGGPNPSIKKAGVQYAEPDEDDEEP